MTMKGVCRVCELLDNDTTEKEVEYCITCGQWICLDDEFKYIRRGLAMIKEKTNEHRR